MLLVFLVRSLEGGPGPRNQYYSIDFIDFLDFGGSGGVKHAKIDLICHFGGFLGKKGPNMRKTCEKRPFPGLAGGAPS